MSKKQQIQAWKDQLPDDLKYGEFEEDFLIFSAKDYRNRWQALQARRMEH